MSDLFQLRNYILIFAVCFFLQPKFGSAQCLSERDVHPILFYPANTMNLSSIQNFSIDLFKEVVPKNQTENFVFSPYSVWNALVLAYLGSAGETEKQLKTALRVPDKITTFNMWKQFRYMCRKRAEENPDNIFLTASRAYFDDGIKLKQCMIDLLKDDIKQLDCKNNASVSANMINDFISENTREYIKEIVTSADLEDAKLTIVNAAFFKGKWTIPFPPELTKPKLFNSFDGQKILVPMMHQRDTYKYTIDGDGKFDIIELPYVGNFTSMYIFRPREINVTVFDQMINNLTDSKINSLLSSMNKTDVEVCLPKFSLESSISKELMDALKELGVTDAFNKETANFTGFTSDSGIFIKNAIHKTFLKADENGTTAASGTSWIQPTSLPLRFSCDRPFVFLIRDNDTKNILFMGTYKTPFIEFKLVHVDT